MMNAKLYQEKRDELARLLDHCVGTIDALSHEHTVLNSPDIGRNCEALRRIRAKVYEDQFKIALIAKFQGGKSTTFNTLAGGLPLSPMGDTAIATSACVCRAWNVTDPTKRGVSIVWRSDEELLLTVMDLLRDQFIKLASDRFMGKTATVMASELKLSNPTDRDLLARGVQAEIVQYFGKDESHRAEAMASYTKKDCSIPDGKPAIPGYEKPILLFIAAVISRYYGHPEFEQIKKQTFTPEDVGKLLRFPAQLTQKRLDFLAGKTRDGFSPRELAFAFIREVHLRLDSAALADVGTAITDCPGLSASVYDTRVAMQIIGESDAVWYMSSAARAFEDSQLADIACARTAAGGKVFFTGNMDRGVSRDDAVNTNIPDQMARLSEMGVNVELKPYHALLAYLAAVGPALLQGKATAATQAELVEHARKFCRGLPVEPDAKEAWAKFALCMLRKLDIPEETEFAALPDKLSENGISIVRRASELDTILAQIQGYVIENKATCILVTGGVEQAIQAIEVGIEMQLLAREIDAEKTEDECRIKYDYMKAKLDAFRKDSASVLQVLSSSDTDRALAGDFIDTVIVPSIPDAAAFAAPLARKKISLLDALWGLAKKVINRCSGDSEQKQTESEMKVIVRSAFEIAAAPVAQGWAEGVKTGKNPHFNTFLRQVENCAQRIRRDWEREVNTAPDLQTIPTPIGVRDAEASVEIQSPDNLKMKLDQLALEDGMEYLSDSFAGYAVLGTIAFILPGIGTVFTIVATAIWMLILKYLRGNEDEIAQRIKRTIEDSLRDGVTKERQTLITKIAEEFAKLRQPYIALFHAGFKMQTTAFEKQRQQAEADHRVSQEVRQLLAKECFHIRTKHIAPLRKILGQYLKDVLPLLPRHTLESVARVE